MNTECLGQMTNDYFNSIYSFVTISFNVVKFCMHLHRSTGCMGTGNFIKVQGRGRSTHLDHMNHSLVMQVTRFT